MKLKTKTLGYSEMEQFGCFECQKCVVFQDIQLRPFNMMHVFCTLNEVEIEQDISSSKRCLSFQKYDDAPLKSLLGSSKKLTWEVKQ